MWSPKRKMWSPKQHFYFKKSVILSLNSSDSIQSSLIVLPDSEYCFCTKFGQLILRKIIKTVATRMMSDFKAKMHQNPAPPQTPLGELTALPQTPQLDLRGPTSKGRGGDGRDGRGGVRMGGEGKGEEGREGRGRECCGVQQILKIDSALNGRVIGLCRPTSFISRRLFHLRHVMICDGWLASQPRARVICLSATMFVTCVERADVS